MKQCRILRLVIAATLLVCGSAAAQVTSPGNNKPLPPSAQKAPPFQPGGADLSALLAEINALQDRVRKLEGDLTEADLAGGYTLLTYQTAIAENVDFIEHLVSGGTLQLMASGAFSSEIREMGFTARFGKPSVRDQVTRSDAPNGTWTYSAGLLTLNIDGELLPFSGGVGGRFFVSVGANPVDGTTTLLLLVKNR